MDHYGPRDAQDRLSFSSFFPCSACRAAAPAGRPNSPATAAPSPPIASTRVISAAC